MGSLVLSRFGSVKQALRHTPSCWMHCQVSIEIWRMFVVVGVPLFPVAISRVEMRASPLWGQSLRYLLVSALFLKVITLPLNARL